MVHLTFTEGAVNNEPASYAENGPVETPQVAGSSVHCSQQHFKVSYSLKHQEKCMAEHRLARGNQAYEGEQRRF